MRFGLDLSCMLINFTIVRVARSFSLNRLFLAARPLSSFGAHPSKSFSTVADVETMPQPPFTHGSLSSIHELDLSALGDEIAREDERRTAASDLSRRLQRAYNNAKDSIDFNFSPETQTEHMASLQTLLDDPLIEKNRHPRAGSLSYRLEDYARLRAMDHFLKTATLWPLPEDSPLTDEEYLAGACMGLAQDLQRYGLGRATVRDTASVSAAKDLVELVLDFLIQIDFRNGPLRSKYDRVKYALQALERLLYELAVTDGTTPTEPASKKTKPSTETPPELVALKERMEHRDLLREKLIKRCRDGQKAAKQAIFALHRGDQARAESLMEDCEVCIRELIPTIEEEPPLRSGSFANMVEEYVEAKLFSAWLSASSSENQGASGKILVPSDFTVIPLLPDEYLGGLCDLTGEIGRFAVQRGTNRDVEGVRLCLHSNQRILSTIQSLPVFPSGIGKKMDQLRRSVEKLERILYELSLSEAAGGRPVHTEVEGGEQDESQ